MLIDVSDPALDTAALNANLDVQVYEYQKVINDYLGSPTTHAPVHSLADITEARKLPVSTPALSG